MNVSPSPDLYGRLYDLTLDVIKQHGLDFGAKCAAVNTTDPAIPPYYYLKNCILVARAQADWDLNDLYRLNAEQKYDSSFHDAILRPDDGSLKVLRELRGELDDLYTSREASVSASESVAPPLLLGWIPYLDISSGRCYYYNLLTLATQWEFPYSLEMVRGTDRELGEEVMVSRIGDKVEVEDEMDNEDEDEDGDVDEDYDEGDDDYGEDDDTEALTHPVQPTCDRETFIQDQSSSLAVDLDLLTGVQQVNWYGRVSFGL
ncbi:hypothetical protein CC77DRAFT_1004654 [Alternaria alternata]|uniref:WW domain-containing protein n=1 Tax=Alternaria alternata TaxID=5599 RepID=A0A177E190_ALTAL|nr:hypothetical protein CC77DRAFT_1004654 [Alternaria alternata]OAG24972.1 hypothetical protein CC77DRAFT_1004654 [Alternaria alternata]